MFDDTVAVLTAATTADSYTGDPVEDWDLPPVSSVTVAGEVQPLSSIEAVLTAQTVVSRWRAFLEPLATDGTAYSLTAASRISHDGTVYEVDGKPDVWKVAGQVDHYELILKLVE